MKATSNKILTLAGVVFILAAVGRTIAAGAWWAAITALVGGALLIVAGHGQNEV